LLAGRFEKLNQERRSQLKLLNETLAASAPKALCSMAEESSTYRRFCVPVDGWLPRCYVRLLASMANPESAICSPTTARNSSGRA
jgi:hypothetical protein